MIFAVISLIFISFPQYYLNCSCDSLSLVHHSFISSDLVALLTIVLLVNPTAVELSVWIGVRGCCQPISMSVLRSGIIFFAVMHSAAISDSAPGAITGLIICAIVKIGPLIFGLGSFSESNICAPARLLAFDLLRKPASACAANIISLFRKMIPSSGLVASKT